MKSTLVSVKDIDECTIPTFCPQGIENVVDGGLTTLRRRHASVEDHQAVQEGDIVRLRMLGPTPPLTHASVNVIVGKGLFDADLETSLIGLVVGPVHVVSHPAGQVEVTVLTAQGRRLPALTDELIQHATGGAVPTVAAYRKQLYDAEYSARRGEFLNEATWDVLDELVCGSQAVIDDSDIKFFVDRELEHCRHLAAEEGKVFEEMSPEQLQMTVAVDSIESFIERAEREAGPHITRTLLGAHYEGRSPRDAAPAELDELHLAASRYVRAYVEKNC